MRDREKTRSSHLPATNRNSSPRSGLGIRVLACHRSEATEVSTSTCLSQPALLPSCAVACDWAWLTTVNNAQVEARSQPSVVFQARPCRDRRLARRPFLGSNAQSFDCTGAFRRPATARRRGQSVDALSFLPITVAFFVPLRLRTANLPGQVPKRPPASCCLWWLRPRRLLRRMSHCGSKRVPGVRDIHRRDGVVHIIGRLLGLVGRAAHTSPPIPGPGWKPAW
jgi:hypothetical protein